MLDKRAVGLSFGKAARQYDQYAYLQKRIAGNLRTKIKQPLTGTAIDLGAGTGNETLCLKESVPGARWISLDLSLGMLEYACKRPGFSPEITPICADAESIPLADNSVSLVFSSFALQWCTSPKVPLDEINRVLTPGGQALIAIPVDPTLHELKSAWAQVDQNVHVNQFHTSGSWQENQQGWQSCEVEQEQYVEYFSSFLDIGRSLKAIGAHNMNRQRNAGLTTPGKIKKVEQAYAAMAKPKGLPVTWQVLYLSLIK